MLELIRLDIPANCAEIETQFGHFVPANLHCCFHGENPFHLSDHVIIAIGAFWQGKPVGIALASCGTIFPQVDVHYLFVQPEQRNKHIGRQLLGKLQAEAHQAGGRYFFLIYEKEDECTAALEKVIAANAWRGTRPFILRCLYDVYKFDMPIADRHYAYPSGFTEFAWKDLTAAERQYLQNLQQGHGFKSNVSPFNDEKLIEPLNSIGLRHNGEVVGWMITHRLDSEMIRYTALWVEPGLQFHRLAPKLVFNSIRKHLQTPTHWALLEIPLLQVNATWKRFVEERLVPPAYKVTHLMQAWHVYEK